VQTKLNIIASAFIGISGLCALVGHNALAFIFFIIGILLYLIAFLSKDKKDNQIEEIHRITTTKLKPYLVNATNPTISTKEPKQSLSEMHEEVLNLLFKGPTEIKNICKVLSLTTEEVKYYLDELRKRDMVSMPPIYPAGPGDWSISQKGREYVMAHRASEKTVKDAWNTHT